MLSYMERAGISQPLDFCHSIESLPENPKILVMIPIPQIWGENRLETEPGASTRCGGVEIGKARDVRGTTRGTIIPLCTPVGRQASPEYTN